MNPTLERVTNSLISLIPGGRLTIIHIVSQLIGCRLTTRLALAKTCFLSKFALDLPFNTRYYITFTLFVLSGTSGYRFLLRIWPSHTVIIRLHLCCCTLAIQNTLSGVSTHTIVDFSHSNCITGTCNMLRLIAYSILRSSANSSIRSSEVNTVTPVQFSSYCSILCNPPAVTITTAATSGCEWKIFITICNVFDLNFYRSENLQFYVSIARAILTLLIPSLMHICLSLERLGNFPNYQKRQQYLTSLFM